MTYKQLIDTLTTILEDHKLINQWGYGNLSDIETPETGAPNYPYVFINPVQVLIQSYGFDVTLNLITMDQPLDGVAAEIDAASRTLGLIQDVIARFKQTTLYAETDVILSVTCTPFKERFKDSVIGNTATITFQIEEPLDVCYDPVIVFDELVWVYSIGDVNYGPDPGDNKSLSFTGINLNDGGWIINKYVVSEAGYYKLVLDIAISVNTPAPGEVIPNPPKLLQLTSGPDISLDPTVATGWPTVFVDNTEVYNVHLEYEVDAPYYEGGYVWEFVNMMDQVGTPETTINMKAGSELKIYKQL